MSFFVFTCVGIALGVVHLFVPGEHRLGPASAVALGIVGAWGGALLVGTLRQGGWIAFGLPALAGAVIGAAGAIVGLEAAAEAYLRREGREG